jgi:hypothetical protein
MKLNKKQTLFLQLIKSSTPREQKLLVPALENDLIKVLSEVIYNFLHGNVSVGGNKILQLRRHKQSLRALSSRSVSLDKKRSILQQSGRGALLPLLFPILSSALGGII